MIIYQKIKEIGNEKKVQMTKIIPDYIVKKYLKTMGMEKKLEKQM